MFPHYWSAIRPYLIQKINGGHGWDRDQEEGGELDSHKEASPEEIKSRELVLG